MTIYEYDRVSAGPYGYSTEHAHTLVDRLNAGEPYAVAFGGQGGRQGVGWLEHLEELVSSAGLEDELVDLVTEAYVILEPIADELAVVRPVGFEPLHWMRAHAAGDPLPSIKQLMSAATTVAPSDASLRAVSAPIPLAPPVMIAVLPAARFMIAPIQ